MNTLENLKNRPPIDKIRKEVGSKEETDARNKALATAELKKLSEILNNRSDKPLLKEVYVEAINGKIRFGEPTLGEFLEVLQKSRESGNMSTFLFDLLYVMMKKADPELTPESLKTKAEIFESMDLLTAVMDVSPFFKKALSLRASGKFNLP